MVTYIWAGMGTLTADCLATCYAVGRNRPPLGPGAAVFGILFNLGLIGWGLSLVAT